MNLPAASYGVSNSQNRQVRGKPRGIRPGEADKSKTLGFAQTHQGRAAPGPPIVGAIYNWVKASAASSRKKIPAILCSKFIGMRFKKR